MEKANDMERIFSGCSSLRTMDLSSFNLGKYVKAGKIFLNCDKLSQAVKDD